MAKISPIPNLNVANEIQDQARLVGELATLLSNRIITFENWLNDLPGRVEAYVWVPSPNSGPLDPRDFEFGLMLRRVDKRWGLHFDYSEVGEDEVHWKPLADANLDVKMEAIGAFPKLLNAIKVAQEKRVKELQSTHAKLQALADDLGLILDGEGK